MLIVKCLQWAAQGTQHFQLMLQTVTHSSEQLTGANFPHLHSIELHLAPSLLPLVLLLQLCCVTPPTCVPHNAAGGTHCNSLLMPVMVLQGSGRLGDYGSHPGPVWPAAPLQPLPADRGHCADPPGGAGLQSYAHQVMGYGRLPGAPASHTQPCSSQESAYVKQKEKKSTTLGNHYGAEKKSCAMQHGRDTSIRPWCPVAAPI